MNKKFMKRILLISFTIILLFTLIGCAAEQKDKKQPQENNKNQAKETGFSKEDLNEQLVLSAVWYQTAGEMRALAYQAFNFAKINYEIDLIKNKNDKTKRAVIVDVDETVLDNSPYEAGLIREDRAYPDKWDDWINSAKAEPVPGALEFLNYVADNGGDVYYITNRKEHLKEATLKNLTDMKFPQATEDHLLLRTDSSDKEPRRQQVSKDHRIVLLIGDNLNDFESIYMDKSITDRFAAVDQNKGNFGTKFIILPNPMYGDWEGAVYEYKWDKSPKEKSEDRIKNLNQWNK